MPPTTDTTAPPSPPAVFPTVVVIGLGLIGSSLARAARRSGAATRVLGADVSREVCDQAAALGFLDGVSPDVQAFAPEADLVVLAIPVGAVPEALAAIAPHLKPGAVLTDVGSVKGVVADAFAAGAPEPARAIPAHPVAGTEQSGPAAGFAALFENRWCILTPPDDVDADALARLEAFWRAVGARVDVMDAQRHDRVLAATSHLPHLIAYTIVGTASDLEQVTEAEVVKYSAGGFRDFTRIAASDPTMWRDIFLTNREAVLELLGRFTEDLIALQRSIRWSDGAALKAHFERTRAIRREVIDTGQDTVAPDFGRRAAEPASDPAASGNRKP